MGSQSTRQCTGREVVGSQTWFIVRQICKEAYSAKLTSNIQAKILNAECAGNVYLIHLSFKTMVFP